MKRETYLYTILGFLTVALVLLQFKISDSESNKQEANIQSYNRLDQLLIEVESNIFLVEGEKINILVEGPSKLLDKINTSDMGGCISIKNENPNFISSFINSILAERNIINLYITVPDLDDYIINNTFEAHNIKYQTEDRIGISVQKGEKVIIESKNVKGCT